MNICICCHTKLLRHFSRDKAYWFCPTCHQEMLNVTDSSTMKKVVNRRYATIK